MVYNLLGFYYLAVYNYGVMERDLSVVPYDCFWMFAAHSNEFTYVAGSRGADLLSTTEILQLMGLHSHWISADPIQVFGLGLVVMQYVYDSDLCLQLDLQQSRILQLKGASVGFVNEQSYLMGGAAQGKFIRT